MLILPAGLFKCLRWVNYSQMYFNAERQSKRSQVTFSVHPVLQYLKVSDFCHCGQQLYYDENTVSKLLVRHACISCVTGSSLPLLCVQETLGRYQWRFCSDKNLLLYYGCCTWSMMVIKHTGSPGSTSIPHFCKHHLSQLFLWYKDKCCTSSSCRLIFCSRPCDPVSQPYLAGCHEAGFVWHGRQHGSSRVIT